MIRPLRFTAEEFALMVRQEVEERGAKIVMIDSVAGYRLSLHDQDLVAHLHEGLDGSQRAGLRR